MSPRRSFLLGLLFSLLMAAAFAPVGFWPAVFVAAAPLMLVAAWPTRLAEARVHTPVDRTASDAPSDEAASLPPRGTPSQGVAASVPCCAAPRERLWVRAASAGAGTLPFWLWVHVWLVNVTAVGYVGMCLVLAAIVGSCIWLMARLAAGREETARGRGGESTELGESSPSPGPLPRGGGVRAVMPLIVAAPIMWTAVEVLRGEVLCTGYPWYLLGHPLIDAPVLAAPAAWGGVYLVSYLVAVVNAAVAQAVIACFRSSTSGAGAGAASDRRRANGPNEEPFPQPPPSGRGRRGAVAAAGGLAALAVLAGVISAWLDRSPSASGPTLRVAVLQTDLLTDNKVDWTPEQRARDFLAWSDLTRRAAAAMPKPDLIIWPETSFPGLLDEESIAARPASSAMANRLFEVQREIETPILIGSLAFDGLRPSGVGVGGRPWDHVFNSALLVTGGRTQRERYDKIELTPFGEFMPYVPVWLQEQILKRLVPGWAFDLGAGTRRMVFEISSSERTQGSRDRASIGIVTPICFEATKTRLCRRLVYGSGPADSRRADVMVNLTNDGWFSFWDPGRWHHLQNARWRCVELGVPMVRAANTGVSCVIDASGRLLRAGPDGPGPAARREGVMIADVPLNHRKTVYSAIGNLFGWLVLAAGGLLAAWGLRPRGRRV